MVKIPRVARCCLMNLAKNNNEHGVSQSIKPMSRVARSRGTEGYIHVCRTGCYDEGSYNFVVRHFCIIIIMMSKRIVLYCIQLRQAGAQRMFAKVLRTV
jgi:hypothetical protein